MDHQFTKLPLKTFKLKKFTDTYRVFSDAEHYEDINAGSAKSAIEKRKNADQSKPKDPYKILCLSYTSTDKILSTDDLEIISAPNSTPAVANTNPPSNAAPVAANTVASTPVPPASPAINAAVAPASTVATTPAPAANVPPAAVTPEKKA